MSRMGNKPINIIDGVNVEINNSEIVCTGKLGKMTVNVSDRLNVSKKDNVIVVERRNNDKFSKSIHGTTRKLIINAIAGVNTPFTKSLEVNGIGYRVALKGKDLELVVGYSHPVIVNAPENIEFKVNKNVITVSGMDKQAVGQIAAQIRSVRKPEPYKGKGIKYSDEIIRRKAGKSAKSGAK